MAIQATYSVHVHFCPYSPVSKGNPANKQKQSFKGICLQLLRPKTGPTSPVWSNRSPWLMPMMGHSLCVFGLHDWHYCSERKRCVFTGDTVLISLVCDWRGETLMKASSDCCSSGQRPCPRFSSDLDPTRPLPFFLSTSSLWYLA